MTKLFNNVTTRSNVFAMWLTVGFFEVYDPQYTLGQEIGKDQGQNLRHHMFAILDRSALTINGTAAATGATAVTQLGWATITPTAMTNIQPGTIVTLDSGTNQETVAVAQVSATAFTAKFSKKHAAGYSIWIGTPGNPGPQATFMPKDNSAVVPYFVIVD